MVIIFQKGNEFWIEQVIVSVTIPDAAGRTTGGNTTLQRAGIFVGGAIAGQSGTDNDNSQAIGNVELRGTPTGTLTLGVFVSGVGARVAKQLGTAGNTVMSYNAIVMLRGRHVRV